MTDENYQPLPEAMAEPCYPVTLIPLNSPTGPDALGPTDCLQRPALTFCREDERLMPQPLHGRDITGAPFAGVRIGRIAHLQKQRWLAGPAQIIHHQGCELRIVRPDENLADAIDIAVEQHCRDIAAELLDKLVIGLATEWCQQHASWLE